MCNPGVERAAQRRLAPGSALCSWRRLVRASCWRHYTAAISRASAQLQPSFSTLTLADARRCEVPRVRIFAVVTRATRNGACLLAFARCACLTAAAAAGSPRAQGQGTPGATPASTPSAFAFPRHPAGKALGPAQNQATASPPSARRPWGTGRRTPSLGGACRRDSPAFPVAASRPPAAAAAARAPGPRLSAWGHSEARSHPLTRPRHLQAAAGASASFAVEPPLPAVRARSQLGVSLWQTPMPRLFVVRELLLLLDFGVVLPGGVVTLDVQLRHVVDEVAAAHHKEHSLANCRRLRRRSQQARQQRSRSHGAPLLARPRADTDAQHTTAPARAQRFRPPAAVRSRQR